MRELTLLSLFDGSGGLPLAASMCGIRPVACSEVEPYPIAVTRSRFPDMKHLGDISKVSGYEIDPVDIITFGSPCQDLSIAGKRAGLKHEANGDEETTRSGLFMEAVRIIKEMREATNGLYPRFALWENVPGAFSSNKGEDFRIVLEELIKIVEPEAVMPAVPAKGWAYADSYVGDGWSLAYRVFDAQYWGVPQRRRRIHLVLDLGGKCAREILFEREGLRGYFAEGGTPRKAVAGDAQNCAGADDRERNCLTPWDVQSRRVFTVDGTWPALYGGEGGGHGYVVLPYTQPCVLEAAGFKAGQSMAGGIGWQEECAATLAAQCSGTEPTVCIKECLPFDTTQVTSPQTGTLQAKPNGGFSMNCNQVVRVQYIVRRLTPTECARLQGFPDDWGHPDHKEDFTDEEYQFWLDVRNTHATINGKAAKEYTKAQMLTWYNKLHTDSAEYKMYGNGIALPPALYCMQGMAEAMEVKTK